MAKKKPEIEIIEENENKEKTESREKKPVLTLFLFLTPILLMAYTPDVITKWLLFCYLAILLKNFIDDQSSSTGA
jgi:hypothetical protein